MVKKLKLSLGFTLLEVLIVAFLAGLIFFSVIVQFAKFNNRKKVLSSVNIINNAINLAKNYSLIYKTKSEVNFIQNNNIIKVNVIGYINSTDTKLLKTESFAENTTINPKNSAINNTLPKIIFNENFYSTDEMKVLYPSYYINNGFDTFASVITLTNIPIADATLKKNIPEYYSIYLIDNTSKIKVFPKGITNNVYFKN